jgi:hypothetical protein
VHISAGGALVAVKRTDVEPVNKLKILLYIEGVGGQGAEVYIWIKRSNRRMERHA